MLARLVTDRRGTTAVEFALVAPLLLALLLGVVELGRLIWLDAVLDHALARAARCAAPSAAVCADELDARLEAGLARLGVSGPAAHVERRPAPCGTEVEARLFYPALVPDLWPELPQLAARACLPAR